MATQNLLKEDLTFKSYDDVDTFIKKWSAEQMSPLITRSSFRGNENTNGRIQYVCPHGVERKSKSKGARPKQHVMYTNCAFAVNVNENRKKKVWTITKLNTRHPGHMLRPDVYG